jgi:probable F420-dependent oxidoreductase
VRCTLTLKLPTHRVDAPTQFGSAAAISEMARAAEDMGYAAVSVTDHPMPGTAWLQGGGHHTLDPFVTLAVAAAATSTLILQTALLVLPYRHPLIVAKAAANLDVVSQGRVALGVGTGYVPSEFAALGADFADRNEVTDRAIHVIKRAWQPDPLLVEGGDPLGHSLQPRPIQQPHPPLYVGGNSRRAMLRAAEHGNGWMPMFNPAELAARRRSGTIGGPAELATKIVELHRMAATFGRIERPLVHYSSGKSHLHSLCTDPGRLRAELDALADAGADAVSVDVPGETRQDWLAAARRLSEAALGA